ncbi:hypothetical protein HYC85_018155 [Camellia sinensis]|uniref:Uncharacterized protein n=1 Tax=Camellia sinensis TaxID=4442 RepID=A0A7J7GXF1_CAMSI|nr:hypothetical protein HYC85_018155 [Camellia sinensis]
MESYEDRCVNCQHNDILELRTANASLQQCNSFILNSIPVLVTVTSFGMFTLLGGNLTPSRAFTSLSLFAVLRFPLNMLPNLITQVLPSSAWCWSGVELRQGRAEGVWRRDGGSWDVLWRGERGRWWVTRAGGGWVANANVSLQRLEELFLAEERILLPNPPLEPELPAISIKNGYFSWDSKVLVGMHPTSPGIAPSVLVIKFQFPSCHTPNPGMTGRGPQRLSPRHT